MGVLVHGKVVNQVTEFWNYLIEIGFFVKLEK